MARVAMFEPEDDPRRRAESRYRAALTTLSSADRDLIVLRTDQKRSYEEIAERCGLASSNEARVAVARALMRLASVMSDT